ncbi:hypothetical protein D8674_031944 [Pyrus ussuriensis x Pyrus communis]|uniref:Transmembrane protein n=1 Tax=Pyrus ussuriensis x Pyrus communis TaxID=2448454 RepID=A0A5N5FDI5_9ROSA|nr:hypothetical protein D8674_031944 [Pyrus ussuriensis x Pyrus communis]
MSLISPSSSVFPIPFSLTSGWILPSLLLPLSQSATSSLHRTRLCFLWKVRGIWLLVAGSRHWFVLAWMLCGVKALVFFTPGVLVGRRVGRLGLVAFDIASIGRDCKVLGSSVALFVCVRGALLCVLFRFTILFCT